MLLGVFLFFILVALFGLSILNSNIHKTANQIAEGNTVLNVISLSNTPEFICGDKTNCVDGDKIIGLVDNSDYANYWPFSSLRIIRESGFSKNESQMIECSSENYPKCDVFVIYDKNKKERATQGFVALCRKEVENGNIYDKCEIAKIIAGTEIK